jgi:predicted nicotinamide N-methyase
MTDVDEEEFAAWECTEEREAVLRYRPGNRFVPGFADLVDRQCRWFWLALSDGSVGWAPSPPRSRDASTVVVEVAYRAAEGEADTTASTIWDSAVVLSRYLALHHLQWDAERTVELGAGCGLVGLCWAALTNKPVVMTDLPSCLDRLRANAEGNESVRQLVTVEPLSWGDCDAANRLVKSGERLLVLAADCLLPYSEPAMRALAVSIAALLRGNGESVALVAYEERCSVAPFFDCLEEQSMHAVVLETWDKGTLRLLHITRRE